MQAATYWMVRVQMALAGDRKWLWLWLLVRRRIRIEICLENRCLAPCLNKPALLLHPLHKMKTN